MTSRPFHFATAAAALSLAALSPQAFACDPVAGALVGGGIGAVIGNGPGAAVGAVIGSTIAAATPCYDTYPPRAAYYEPRYADDRRYYAPQPSYAQPQYAQPQYAEPAYAAPSYYAPAPTYYAPAPYYYSPSPIVYAAAAAIPYFVYRGARYASYGRHYRRWH
ncbi:MAG TPA: hypothetical protein VF287_01375 [Usitatibacter sp.]